MMRKRGQEGFTLIEIMAALALLGGAIYILLDSHFTSLWLYDSTRRAVVTRSLIEEAVGRAEVEIFAGNLKGTEELGDRYPDYTYSYLAELAGDDEVALYQVAVTVEGPEFEETVTYLLYDVRY